MRAINYQETSVELMNHSVDVLLSFGSNIGNKVQNINNAISLIYKDKLIFENINSSFYETEPFGFKNQENFINLSMFGKTKKDPFELLSKLKFIETKLGRISNEKWHERLIDIDIIFYGNMIVNSGGLCIPHPELHKRNFVLIPSSEIARNFVHPVFNKTIDELRLICTDNSAILKL